ncbi:MAG TPA: outer membrane protein transport protein [Pseudolabrys sp.]|nr:outer membrane protein transport protein [Pseudolabrys sp.]
MGRGLGSAAQKAAKFAICLTAATLAATAAQATEGYFQYGYGARQGALAGAGVADSRDAMSLSLNPAGLVDVGRQFQVGAALFAPFRSYTGTGTGFVAPGSYDSGTNYFVVPNLAYSSPIDANSAWGVALFGNGGMNTGWPTMVNTSPGCGGGIGVFCGGKAGVDLMQAFLAFGYAHRFGNFSFGLSPVIAIQRFRAIGLGAFAGISSDPTHLTDKGYDYSYGGGVRAGVQWSVMPNVRLGLSGQTPMWMTKFDKYAGLFAGGGDFDIPGNVTAGVAWDAMPNLTLMADYKHIFYGSIPSIADSSTTPLPLGSSNGPGFGWHDIDIIKLGVEWRATPVWTLRAGYAHNANPIKSSDVTFNILAPGVVTDHFTGGFAYKVSPNSTLEFAAAYIPKHSVSGVEVTPLGPTPGSNIDISMHQFQFTVGYTYQFDTPAPAKGLIVK